MIDDDLTPEERAELGDLNPLYDRLNQHVLPEPDSSHLLSQLTPLLQKHAVPVPPIQESQHRTGFRAWLRLAWAEAKLFEGSFWLSSVLLTLIGVILGVGYGGDSLMLVLVFVAPFIALIGVAYIFRPATQTLWEMEQFSLYHPVQLLYARIIVILVVNAAVALVLMLMAWSQGVQLILWRLLLLWFGPLMGFMGLALFCTLRWNRVAGWGVPIIVWAAISFSSWRQIVLDMTWANPIPYMMRYIQTSDSLLSVALLMFVLGVIAIHAAGREVSTP